MITILLVLILVGVLVALFTGSNRANARSPLGIFVVVVFVLVVILLFAKVAQDWQFNG